ncbi:MAG: aldehyde dehydrogenase family protein, partial [Bacteroidota bacterium]
RGGIEVKLGGEIDEADNYIAPTVIESHDLQSDLLQEEIFGPVLPITTFRTIPELLTELNTREKPLCLYIYSTSKKNIREITRNTRAGTTAINNSAVHFYINNLPFGGSNKSGMGNAHGFYSFKAFSDSRAFYRQNFMGAVELLRPPFKESWKQKLIDLTIRWL